jgi:preprotein translocase subunit SecA
MMTTAPATPSAAHRLTHLPDTKTLHRGLEAKLWAVAGWWRRRGKFPEEASRQAAVILTAQTEHAGFSDKQLREAVRAEAGKYRRPGAVTDVTPGLALIVETAKRTLGLQPYREQVMGALALHHGWLAEMATGEGKTLTIGLGAALAGWTGRPLHVVTANDYLAERDAANLRPFYHACGLTVGHVQDGMESGLRRLNYSRDVVYGTSKEILADFLRDRIALGEFQDARRRTLHTLLSSPPLAPDALIQRGLDTAIVDEADHVLIDEAVTPLIISRPRENELLTEAVVAAHAVAQNFVLGDDFTTETKFQEITLTAAGQVKLAAVPADGARLFRNGRWKRELVVQAVRAREFFLRGKHYIVQDDRVVLVDETTGRPAPQRSWRQGLHQAIEVKEGLPLTPPAENLASLSFQRYFRLYRRLSGVTGTGWENRRELWHIYHLPALVVPTHRPCVRVSEPAVLTAGAAEKWSLVVEEVERVHATGRPVLIGCGTVTSSAILAERLRAAGLDFQLLTAEHLKNEAEIVAGAGQAGQIMVATNLAGRGTDIRLGEGVAAMGGLHVVATERATAGRIDRQLYGRCARQGDPGSVRQFASFEDDLVLRSLPRWTRRTLGWLLVRWPGAGRAVGSRVFAWCQHGTTKLDFRRRLGVLQRDRWLTESLPLSDLDASLKEG